MESGHHCPYVGLKQNRSIRFASPTPEHRCYITGEPQEIPVPQNSFCLSGNHVNCPLYTGQAVPTTAALPSVAPVPPSGIRGWFKGLSPRDRRIYLGLVGLLAVIVLAYLVSAVLLFSNDDSTTAQLTPSSLPVVPTTAAATATLPPASPTVNPAFLTAVARATQTSTALQSQTPTRTPAPSDTPRPTTAVPSNTPIAVIVVPTAVPATDTLPPPSNTPVPPPPSNTPVPPPPPSNTPVPPSNTPEPPTNTPLPTITPETPAPTTAVPVEPTTAVPDQPTSPPAPTEPPAEPTAAPPPTEAAPPTETPGGLVERVLLFYADPSGMLLVPVTRQIDATRQPRTAAINQLIAGPRGALRRLVPPETRLLSLKIADGLAVANFNQLPTYGSSDYSDLGIRSVLLALTEYPDVTQVQLQVNGANIGAPRYRPSVNADNPLNLDGQYSTTSFLPLYFPAASTGQMVRVIRLIPRTSAEARATIEQMIRGAGVYRDVLQQPIPASTSVQRLVISDGLAQIDLSREFLQASDRQAAVDSLTLALTTFSSVSRVQISIEGASLDQFWGSAYSGALRRPALNSE